jgi:hypothetical protein
MTPNFGSPIYGIDEYNDEVESYDFDTTDIGSFADTYDEFIEETGFESELEDELTNESESVNICQNCSEECDDLNVIFCTDGEVWCIECLQEANGDLDEPF